MKRILVAAKATSRELMCAILEQSGRTVYEASDGIEALRCARELAPDLTILDLHMPALDGFGVVQEPRRDQRFANVPIITLTASAMQGDPELALSAGYTSYLAKPISLGALRAEIERYGNVQ
jgi:CheY-like chemotaxis protein